MILVDANLLLYAHHPAFGQHAEARQWLDAQLNGPTRVGLPWASSLAFVRISASPRILERPLSVVQAWRQVEAWLALEPVWTPGPTDRHRTILADLLPYCAPAPALVSDAHLAALAIEHGAELVSYDTDFSRFPGVVWSPPSAG